MVRDLMKAIGSVPSSSSTEQMRPWRTLDVPDQRVQLRVVALRTRQHSKVFSSIFRFSAAC